MTELRERGFELPIHIEYAPPGWLPGVMAVVYLGAVICVLPTSLDANIKIILIVVIITGLFITELQLYRQLYISRPPRLILDSEDRWYLIDSGTNREKLVLKSGGFINPFFALLRFNDRSRNQYFFILSSSNTEENTLRRLRTRLKFKKSSG